jgi:hypothetical protein
MTIEAETVKEYIDAIPEERKEAFKKLWTVIKTKIPEGFEECLSYGLPTFGVPHSIYPDGYHCKPDEPLPFISLANQKNYLGFYHSGMYVDEELSNWFKEKYTALNIGKLDMGKSCVRLKKIDKIPYDLIGELCTKISVQEWIKIYESKMKR